MRVSTTLATLMTAVAMMLVVTASPAQAKCHRFAFAVNDFGKEGPSRDAKELLEKHIAGWAADRGIKKYTVGTKHVACELFLNFIVFDEHTCTATADVCWSGQGPGSAEGREAAVPSTPLKPLHSAAPQVFKAAEATAAPMTTAIVPPKSAAAAKAVKPQ